MAACPGRWLVDVEDGVEGDWTYISTVRHLGIRCFGIDLGNDCSHSSKSLCNT